MRTTGYRPALHGLARVDVIQCDHCGSQVPWTHPTDVPAGWASALTGVAILHRCPQCPLPSTTLNLHPDTPTGRVSRRDTACVGKGTVPARG